MTGDDATFDEELLKDGLWLSLIGMGVVFSVLTLLAIIIKVFDRVDARLPAVATADAIESGSGQTAPIAAVAQTTAAISAPDDAETAAVIGLALALADSQTGDRSAPSSSSSMSPAANSWLTAGRSREMSGRMPGLAGRIRKS